MAKRINSNDDIKIYYNEKHFKVYAGPGAGKTYMIIENIKNIIHNSKKINNYRNILCITYTNIAVDEIKKRLNNYKQYTYVSTIHSFLYQNVIKPYQKQLKIIIKEKFNILIDDKINLKVRKEGDSILSNSTVEDVCLWLKKFKKVDDKTTEYLTKKTITNCVLTFSEKNKYPFNFKDFSPIFMEKNISNNTIILIKEYLWGILGRLDFDEILYFSFELIKKYRFIIYNLQYKFPYVFIDEQQDTNPIQYEIIKTIFDNCNTSVGFIGDIAQSIYSFQGANYRMLENEIFTSKKQIEYVINGNRRSTKNIIHFCNFIRQKDKKLSKQECISNTSTNNKVKIVILSNENSSAKEFIDDNTTILCRRFIDLFKYVEISSDEQVEFLTNFYRTYTYQQNRDLVNDFSDESYDWIKVIKFVCKITNSIKRKDFANIIHELENYLNIRTMMTSDVNKKSNYNEFCKIVILIEKICSEEEKIFINILDEIDKVFKNCNFEYIQKIYNKDNENYFELFDCFTLKTILEIGNKIFVKESKYRTIHKSKGKEYDKVLIELKPSGLSENGINAINAITNPIIYSNNDSKNVLSEFIRIFYVGISRAKDELIVVLEGNNQDAKELDNALNKYCEKENIDEKFYEIIIR